MKKTARLEVREDARLKRTIDELAKRMGITSTDFLRMVIRNGARFYAKKLDIPYLLAFDYAVEIVEHAAGKTAAGSVLNFDDNELKKLEDEVKKLK